MPLPKVLGAYTDIKPVLDQLMAQGGGTIAFSSHGEAAHWRQRAYYFRKLVSERSPTGATPYDSISLRLAKGSKEVALVIASQRRPLKVLGKNGKPLELDFEAEPLDPLEGLDDEDEAALAEAVKNIKLRGE